MTSAASTIGQLASPIASIFQGVAGYQAGQQNAAAFQTAAVNAERTGAAQESRVRDSVRTAVGSQVAGQFSNGLLGGTGTAINDVHQSLTQGALDALTVRSQAAAQAQSYQQKAALAETEGTNSLISGILGAGSKYVQQRSDWAAARRGVVSN